MLNYLLNLDNIKIDNLKKKIETKNIMKNR